MGNKPMNGRMTPQTWLQQLSAKEAPEWLVDCYRLRLDDEFALGGNLRGLYEVAEDSRDSCSALYMAEEICIDFLAFLKAGVKNRAIPKRCDKSSLNWNDCIAKHAPELLPFAFEKSDAEKKWGVEKVFSTTSGRPSLRVVGEQITGISPIDGSEQKKGTASWSEMQQKVREEVDHSISSIASVVGTDSDFPLRGV